MGARFSHRDMTVEDSVKHLIRIARGSNNPDAISTARKLAKDHFGLLDVLLGPGFPQQTELWAVSAAFSARKRVHSNEVQFPTEKTHDRGTAKVSD